MKENKRYYWLKLNEDFFDDETISYIEEQENGKEYCLFYLKLCLKSLKSEGKLMRLIGNTYIPYDTKGLSKLTNTNIDTVANAMNLFQRIGIITVFETGEIYINQIKEMVGTETDKAKYMREKRARNKLEGNNVTPLLPECYTEIEKEIDIELEKDIELDNGIPNNGIPKTKKSSRFVKPTVDEIKAYCEERKNNVNAEHFFDYYESNGWKVGKNSMKDWKATVRTWEKRSFENAPKKSSAYDNFCTRTETDNRKIDYGETIFGADGQPVF